MNTLLALWLAALAPGSPLCLPAATATVLTRLGQPMTAQAVARELPVHVDGVDLFDVRMWLADQGWQVLVLQPDAAQIRQLLEHAQPIVLLRRQPNGTHAVALVAGRGQVVQEVDNRTSQPLKRTWQRALTNAQAVLVPWREERATPRLLFSPAIWQRLLHEDCEFVASGWLRRAAEHKTASGQKRALILRALDASPANVAATAALQAVDEALAHRGH